MRILPFDASEIIWLDLNPRTDRLDDGRRQLVEPWRYHDVEGFIELPAGFVTDYSSVPRRLASLMPEWWKIDLAGLAHDGGYREEPFNDLRRKRWDRAWGRIALAQPNSTYDVAKGYYGLRTGGWTAYGERNPHVQEARKAA